MPRFWVWLCKEWLALPEHLAWAWWRSVGRSQWTRCREFHQPVLHDDRSTFPAQNASREQMSPWMEPGMLMQITAALVTQRLLLRRDAGLIDQGVLDRY